MKKYIKFSYKSIFPDLNIRRSYGNVPASHVLWIRSTEYHVNRCYFQPLLFANWNVLFRKQFAA